jgi:hypothetical protein
MTVKLLAVYALSPGAADGAHGLERLPQCHEGLALQRTADNLH